MTPITNSTQTLSDILFNVPHIVDQICLHLSTQEIYQCCLVSRDFNVTFGSNIFSTININHLTSFEKWASPHIQATLATKLHTIRSVNCGFGRAYDLLQNQILSNPSQPCHLTEIRYRSFFYAQDCDIPSVISVIECCPNLQVLDLDCFGFEYDNPERLATAIRKLGRTLLDLHISATGYVESMCIHSILASSASVRKVTVDCSMKGGLVQLNSELSVEDKQELMDMAMEALEHIGSQRTESKNGTLGLGVNFEWKELYLQQDKFNLDCQLFLRVLRHCPLLESITIPSRFDSARQATSVISNASFPRLQRLNLHFLVDCRRIGHSNFFKTCTNLKSVIFGETVLHPRKSIKTLILNSGHTLESVNLSGSKNLRSVDILTILCSCPCLISFEALKPYHPDYDIYYYAEPILDIRVLESPVYRNMDWACNDLETLRICIRTSDRCINIPGILRRRIKKLTRLRELKLHCESVNERWEHRYALNNALREWKSLSDLETLELVGLGWVTDRKMNEVERQWKKLENLKIGKLH